MGCEWWGTLAYLATLGRPLRVPSLAKKTKKLQIPLSNIRGLKNLPFVHIPEECVHKAGDSPPD